MNANAIYAMYTAAFVCLLLALPASRRVAMSVWHVGWAIVRAAVQWALSGLVAVTLAVWHAVVAFVVAQWDRLMVKVGRREPPVPREPMVHRVTVTDMMSLSDSATVSVTPGSVTVETLNDRFKRFMAEQEKKDAHRRAEQERQSLYNWMWGLLAFTLTIAAALLTM